MMNKIIRWPGLIAFVVITGALVVISIVYIDTWIKLAAEKALETAIGAEVNITNVKHSFSPFGVTLENIQLTDPSQPQNNQIQATQIQAEISLSPLLMRKVIIDQLNISGVKFNQARKTAGKVYRQPSKDKADKSQSVFPDAKSLPSVDDILAKSPLKTTKAIEQAQRAYNAHSETLKTQYAQLPDKSKLSEYKSKIKALTSVDYKDPIKLAEAKKEFEQLKAELKQDKQTISEFKDAVSTAKQDMSPKLAQLKAAPGQDYEQLKALVAGDAAAINDVTKMVFGDKVAQWSEYVLSAYQIAAPMLEGQKEQQVEQQRSQGRWIEFSDTQSLPDLLIRNANISLGWEAETIQSVWHDITYQHDKIGRPTTFKVDSNNTSLWQSLKIDGDFWFKNDGINAKQQWQMQGMSLTNLSLLEQPKLSSAIQQGLLASSGSVSVDKSIINGTGKVDLSQLVMSAKGSNNLTEVIASTLTQLKKLSINTKVVGSFKQPELSFSSDLDKQLGKALLSNLSSDEQGKLSELKQKLNSKIQGPLATSDEQMSQLLNWEKLAEGDLSDINSLLETKLSSLADKEKDKLKDKLKNKLFGN